MPIYKILALTLSALIAANPVHAASANIIRIGAPIKTSVGTAQAASVSLSGPEEVFANAPLTLTWSAENAVKVTLKSNSSNSGVSIAGQEVTGNSLVVTPVAAGPVMYTVTVQNAAGEEQSDSRSVVVQSDPSIIEFTATPYAMPGDNAQLSWSAPAATNFSIDQSIGSVTGSELDVPVGTKLGIKTFTLTASATHNGVTRSSTAQASVTVWEYPTSVMMTGGPTGNVFANAPFVLRWDVRPGMTYKMRSTNAASGIPTMDIDLGTESLQSISPTAVGTYTYTVTATSRSGATATASKTVTVSPDPIITDFEATPSSVTAGDWITLSWTATGEEQSIDQEIGFVAGTSVGVPAGETVGLKTYTLTSRSLLNGVTHTATATVNVNVTAHDQ